MISAYFCKIPPSFLPINTAIKLNTKVVIPIIKIEGIILTFKNAKLTPTASASILVAIASIIKFLVLTSLFSSLSPSTETSSITSSFADFSSSSPFIDS